MHDLVPIVLFISLFGMLFGIYYVRSRENMAMLEKGLNPRENSGIVPKPFSSLKFGLLLTGAGLGLFGAYIMDTYVFIHRTNPNETVPIYFALIGIGGGIGLIISYVIEKKYLDKIK